MKEINENKKRKEKNMLLLLLLATVMMFAAGCGSASLAETFDEDTVIAAAKEVTGYVSEDDYESVWGMMREDLQEQLSADTLKESMDTYFAQRGAFKEYKNIAVVGQKIKDTEEDCAVAVVIAEYENQKVTYTVSFDTDMKVIGFYMK